MKKNYILHLFDSINSIANADSNTWKQRIDFKNERGLISSYCIKRHIRDYLEQKGEKILLSTFLENWESWSQSDHKGKLTVDNYNDYIDLKLFWLCPIDSNDSKNKNKNEELENILKKFTTWKFQFNKFSKTLNKIEPQYWIWTTSTIYNKSSLSQKMNPDNHYVPYALFCVQWEWIDIEENDKEKLLEWLYNSINNYRSVAKAQQYSRFIINIDLKDDYYFWNLQDLLEYPEEIYKNSQLIDNSTEAFEKLDLNKLKDYLIENKLKIEKISYKFDSIIEKKWYEFVKSLKEAGITINEII